MSTVTAGAVTVDLVVLARFDDGTPCNVAIVHGPSGTFLIDSGAGVVEHWGPCPGLPEPALVERGIDPLALAGIVLTHWDWDHSGGIVTGTWGGPLALRFPGVPVYVLDEELAFWRARTDGEEATNCGTAVLATVEAAGLLRRIPDAGAVVPGIGSSGRAARGEQRRGGGGRQVEPGNCQRSQFTQPESPLR